MHSFLDVSGIVIKLRVDLEQLFAVNNQIVYIRHSWPQGISLALSMSNRLHYVMADMGGVVRELEKCSQDAHLEEFIGGPVEPLNDDQRSGLSASDVMILANLESAERDLAALREYIFQQKMEILRTAREGRP